MSCHAPSPPVAVIEEPPLKPGQPRSRFRTIALIGPPNSGKSTLFNRLTGLRQKVANYPGVTVEQRSGRMSGIRRHDLTLIDLPGIYSLAGYSEDARVAVDVLKGLRIPVRPHFGVMGVAPKEADVVDSIPPGYFGGNMDNWRIGKGATMYYPIAVPGGLFSIGDSHASQGDSEMCGTAILG